uniref:Uncharacterized protein n=1 Tax=Rousettus aegyptiacus TaxID=9407 RepID=A0A7J8BPM8_ROUAE|nr:hypothetical protein HJG63_001749 [Rousettus aegyptiacus]
MSKKKKLRTSGGEGIHPLKPPKHPRLRDSDRASQSSELDRSCHPEESEGRAEQSGEELGQVASSSPDKEAGGPSRLLRQPENEPVPFPPSQNSVGRFVPQFAKLRKTVTRQAATREEDLGSGAFSSFPAGRGLGPCWPGTSLHAVGGPFTKAHPSTHEGIQPSEAARMEDATDTMRGLIVELSNLNRMIMNTHRDLEAFKRLSYRKAKPASAPYIPKGAGPHPRGEQSWRNV